MPPALEGRFQPDFDHLPRHAFADDAPAHCQHVRVIMQPAHAGGVFVMAERRSDAAHFPGSHRNAQAASADDDAALNLSDRDRFPDFRAIFGIADGIRVMRPEIHDFMRRERLAQIRFQIFFQLESRVIAS